jgi:hypothetical protein
LIPINSFATLKIFLELLDVFWKVPNLNVLKFKFKENSLIFHGLLLRLQKKIEMTIFVSQSQKSLEKNSWVPITMLCFWHTHLFNWDLLQN